MANFYIIHARRTHNDGPGAGTLATAGAFVLMSLLIYLYRLRPCPVALLSLAILS